MSHPGNSEPWPETMRPTPSTQGPAFRWFVQYRLPKTERPRTSMAEGLTKTDILNFMYEHEQQGVKFLTAKPIAEVVVAASQSRAPAQPPAFSSRGLAKSIISRGVMILIAGVGITLVLLLLQSDHPWLALTVAVLFMIGFHRTWSHYRSTACPKCGAWSRRTLVMTKKMSERDGYETVIRHDQQFNALGHNVGYVARQEQVHVTTSVYKDTYRCGACNHEWADLAFSSYEG